MNFQMRQLAILSLLLLYQYMRKERILRCDLLGMRPEQFPFEKKVTGRVVDSGGKPLAGNKCGGRRHDKRCRSGCGR